MANNKGTKRLKLFVGHRTKQQIVMMEEKEITMPANADNSVN
jgi:hypothetical protein